MLSEVGGLGAVTEVKGHDALILLNCAKNRRKKQHIN